jgi:hypothetical protein
MRKTIFSILNLSFITLCFSVSVNAQSSEKDLDQVELTKQFIGTWTVEIGQDSTILFEVVPHGKGYEQNNHWQAKGVTYMSTKGLMGFQENYQTVVLYHMWPAGGITRDVGKFVTDTKFKWDRFNPRNPNHVSSKVEINFITPDKFNVIFKTRGNKETWDDAVINEWIWTRVKE